MALAGCGRGAKQNHEQRASPETEAAKPAQPPAPKPVRCSPLPGAPALGVGAQSVRSEEDDSTEEEVTFSRGAVEFAQGAADGETFLLGLLNHGAETRALVAVLDSASARVLDLGPAPEQAQPPRVAAQGGHWLALVTGGPSRTSTLRLVGISRRGQELETRLGPELPRQNADAGGADIAVLESGQALLVWDRPTTGGHSSIVGLELDARSLREKSTPVVLTPPGQAASEPRLVAGRTSYWLLWLAATTPPTPPADSADAGLLLEPPSVLFVRELDAAGRPRGAEVAINPDQPAPLVFDARVLPSGRLLVLHRAAPPDRPTDDQPMQLSVVQQGGVVHGHPVDSAELIGPGAPTLIGRVGVDLSWLALEDVSGTTVLASVSADGVVLPTPATGLGGQVVLAGDIGRLLTAEPRGIGVTLQVRTCTVD